MSRQKIIEAEEEEIMEQDKLEISASEETMKKAGLEDLPGVGAATAQKLKEAGFGDTMAIAVASPGEIIEAT
jgi:DNA repair protein RadA